MMKEKWLQENVLKYLVQMITNSLICDGFILNFSFLLSEISELWPKNFHRKAVMKYYIPIYLSHQVFILITCYLDNRVLPFENS